LQHSTAQHHELISLRTLLRRSARPCSARELLLDLGLIGRNIRFHRLRSDLSQAKLAAKIGISFQQPQKYERGVNRIPASRLLRIGQVLGVCLDEFVAGPHASAKPLRPSLAAERDEARLMRAYSLVTAGKLRRLVVALIEVLVSR
jgi:transcriptional regulator with XRE-family HTH domain